MWDTTHIMHKTFLKQWHKRAGGWGSGMRTIFEGWSDEKKDKYEIDEEVYDHMDVSGRPAILFE